MLLLKNTTLYFCSQLRKKFMDVSKKNISYLYGNAKATTFLEMALFIKVKLFLPQLFSCRHQISINTADKRNHAGILSDPRIYEV